jgi:anti-sigma regulatory factor (Ser/Thr protein kinase)
MNETFFHAETVETPVRCVKIRFKESFASPGASGSTAEPLSIFEEFVNRNLAKGYLHFNLDLGNVPLPTPRLIALLIALTVRVRRRQGEVKLLNVLPSARQNFSAFSALSFLTIAPAAVVPAAKAPDKNPLLEDDAAGLTDIAESPLIETFAQKIEEPQPTAAEKRFQLRVESRTANLYQLCDFVTAHAFTAGINEKEISKMKIAVYEACLNVIEHAYHSRPDEWIELRVRYSSERFMIIIQDNGLSFEMKPPEEYDVQEVIDERRSGGFGLHIIRRAMDSVEYLPDAINGNRLVMVKRLT